MSVADEIAKLQKLRGDGALTDEEFDVQKRRLLNERGQVATESSQVNSNSLTSEWSQIPVHKKWWFQVLTTLLVPPIGLCLVTFVPSYRRTGTAVINTEGWVRILFVAVVIMGPLFYLANIGGDQAVKGHRDAMPPTSSGSPSPPTATTVPPSASAKNEGVSSSKAPSDTKSESASTSTLPSADDWALGYQAFQGLDDKVLLAEKDYKFGSTTLKATFACWYDKVIFEIAATDGLGKPDETLFKPTNVPHGRAYSVGYQIDNGPFLDRMAIYEDSYFIHINSYPKLTDADLKKSGVSNAMLPMETLRSMKRLQVKLPIPDLNYPIINVDTATPKFAEFKRVCRTVSQQ
jgi:hypothetical protein